MIVNVRTQSPRADLPILPEAGETERRPVLHRNRIGLLTALGRLPFKEALHRYDAAALAVSITGALTATLSTGDLAALERAAKGAAAALCRGPDGS